MKVKLSKPRSMTVGNEALLEFGQVPHEPRRLLEVGRDRRDFVDIRGAGGIEWIAGCDGT